MLRAPGHGGLRRYAPGFFLFLVVLSLVYIAAFLDAFNGSDASELGGAAQGGVSNLRRRRRRERHFPLHRLTGVRKIPRRIKLTAAPEASDGAVPGAAGAPTAEQTGQGEAGNKCSQCGCFKIESDTDVHGSDLTNSHVGSLQECCSVSREGWEGVRGG